MSYPEKEGEKNKDCLIRGGISGEKMRWRGECEEFFRGVGNSNISSI